MNREPIDDWDAFRKAATVSKLSKAAAKAVFSCFGEKCPEAQPVKDGKALLADPDLREHENVPLGRDVHDYFLQEVLPHVPDAWIDMTKKDEQDGQLGIVGYEINFNRYFCQYQPPRQLTVIDTELKDVESEIAALLGEVTA